VKRVFSAGDELVGIGLMSDIPYNAIFRSVEYTVQGKGQLDNPEAWSKMTTVFRTGLNNLGAKFRS
jgi:hypothetical protein